MTRPSLLDLQAECDDLRGQLAILELAAHRAARVMYRRGYLAGHSAGRKGSTVRGPYRKHTKDAA